MCSGSVVVMPLKSARSVNAVGIPSAPRVDVSPKRERTENFGSPRLTSGAVGPRGERAVEHRAEAGLDGRELAGVRHDQRHPELVADVVDAHRLPAGAARVRDVAAALHPRRLDDAPVEAGEGGRGGGLGGERAEPRRLEVDGVDEHQARQRVELALVDELGDQAGRLLRDPGVDLARTPSGSAAMSPTCGSVPNDAASASRNACSTT